LESLKNITNKTVEHLSSEIEKFKEREAELKKAYDQSEQTLKKRAGELSIINEKLWHEIVERKKVEEELTETLSLLTATLESTADGMLVVDKRGKIAIYNQKFAQMWDIPEAILASGNYDQAAEFSSSQLNNPTGFLKKVKELYKHPGTVSFDTLTLKDGRVFERYSQPQKIGQSIVGRVWSFRDITEQKKAEEALRNTELMLLHAHKMEAIGRLATGVGHEINNPLAVINERAGLMNDLLALSDDNWKDREIFLAQIKGILESVDRCRKITHRLLGLKKRTDVIYKAMNLNSVVKEVLEFMEKESTDKNIRVELNLDEGLPEIVSDIGQLQQVLLNIINNAFEAMENNGQITVSTSIKDKHTLQVSVKDTGEGISDEIIKHIFEPFFTTKSSEKGTGLGLSISYGIMQKLGGNILVDSEVNKGSTFIIHVPKEPLNLSESHSNRSESST
jgi:PAS domain S-box-containing protein